MPHVGSTVPTRTRRMTSPKVGLSGSGSCRAHERTWSSNCLISTAPMSGVLMSVFSQLAHLTTNTCHRRSDMADPPGLRRLCADQTQIRRRADTERFSGSADRKVLAGDDPKLPLVLAVRWWPLLRQSSGPKAGLRTREAQLLVGHERREVAALAADRAVALAALLAVPLLHYPDPSGMISAVVGHGGTPSQAIAKRHAKIRPSAARLSKPA